MGGGFYLLEMLRRCVWVNEHRQGPTRWSLNRNCSDCVVMCISL